ncbi:MAG: 3-hydroxyacyl-CoA dehydrogenase, partial [Chloroflexi bacterium]|nr:3-hydroxyacyl-CoA dehydrogenase [Chloroflexota bacterium]
MGGRLKDRGAIVVGGGGGIGSEIALALAAEGAKVIVNDPGAARDGTGSDTAPADKVVAEIKQRGGTA